MQDSDKPQPWQQIYEACIPTTDALGREIDVGILAAVVVLNVPGINTSGSCEGHLDHGLAYPWVDVEAKGVRQQEEEARIKQKAVSEAHKQQLSISLYFAILNVAILQEKDTFHDDDCRAMPVVSQLVFSAFPDLWYPAH